jgi:hypothetical protein
LCIILNKSYKMQERRILLNESSFTKLCKFGFIIFTSLETGRDDISMTRLDIKNLAKGQIVEKNIGNLYKILLQDNIDSELIKEIIKRSPIYSELYYEL